MTFSIAKVHILVINVVIFAFYYHHFDDGNSYSWRLNMQHFVHQCVCSHRLSDAIIVKNVDHRKLCCEPLNNVRK